MLSLLQVRVGLSPWLPPLLSTLSRPLLSNKMDALWSRPGNLPPSQKHKIVFLSIAVNRNGVSESLLLPLPGHIVPELAWLESPQEDPSPQLVSNHWTHTHTHRYLNKHSGNTVLILSLATFALHYCQTEENCFMWTFVSPLNLKCLPLKSFLYLQHLRFDVGFLSNK